MPLPSRLPLAALAFGALTLSGCAAYDDGVYAGYPAAPDGGYGYDQGGFGGYPGEVRVRSVADFYGPLSRYGAWRPFDRFGQVWIPSVGAGWRPYTIGRWDQQRRWLSDEPFGWATYHYGRWGFDRRIGWFWVPDTRWGPAWVDWRDAGDYWGWSPLSPYGWDSGWGGSGLSVGFGWNFAPRRYFNAPGIHRYIVPSWQSGRFFQRSRPPAWGYAQPGYGQPGWGRPGWQGDGRYRDGRYQDGRPDWRGRPDRRGERPFPDGRPPATRDGVIGERAADGLNRMFRGQRPDARVNTVDPRGFPAPVNPVRSEPVMQQAPPQAPAGAPAWQPPAAGIGGTFQARAPEPRPEPRAEPRFERPRSEPQGRERFGGRSHAQPD